MGAEAALLQTLREGLFLALWISAPAVMVSLIVGLAVGVFQAATQIQEQTLTFVPRLLAVFLVLAATGGWMGAHLVRYTQGVLVSFPAVVR